MAHDTKPNGHSIPAENLPPPDGTEAPLHISRLGNRSPLLRRSLRQSDGPQSLPSSSTPPPKKAHYSEYDMNDFDTKPDWHHIPTKAQPSPGSTRASPNIPRSGDCRPLPRRSPRHRNHPSTSTPPPRRTHYSSESGEYAMDDSLSFEHDSIDINTLIDSLETSSAPIDGQSLPDDAIQLIDQ